MSLYKRGDFYWYDFTIAGDRYRGPTKQRGKAAARKVEDQARERAALGAPDRPNLTIEQASARWFVARAQGRKSEKTTAQRLEIMLRLIGPDTSVVAIDAPEVEDAIQRRRLERTRQGKLPTNATVNRDLIDSTLRPVLRYCKRILKLPVAEPEWRELRLPEPRGRNRAFTPAEIAAWRGQLLEHHQAIFDFIARYGVRLREAFFPPEAFEPETGIVTIRKRKNDEPHVIKLQSDDARDMAARYSRAIEAELKTLWYRERRGVLRPVTWRGFQNASQRALAAARIDGARPVHDLRHHAATAFLRLPGGDLSGVKRLLGHEHITSTARYAHVTAEDVFNVMRHAIGTVASEGETEYSENNALEEKRRGT